MIDLVIFDCDGVLVDSEILAAQVTCQTLDAIGLTMSVEDTISSLVGLDAMAARRKLETIHGVPLPVDFEARLAERLDHAFNTQLKPIAGIAELLRGLDQPYCVASNSGRERLRCTFAATGLAPLVEGRVFSADDVARGKPAPDLFLYAAKTMGGVPPERCLVIEDSVTGVTAARAAGMRVIGFCGGGHILPGHDQRLLSLGADRIMTDHYQLAALPWLVTGVSAVVSA
ncbi:HAD family hydrolase [Pseudaminobacter soli (ex Li et al. 2025)]|uniref:HAD family hydrolase n=1 Tax=Pseudaminobacter soli (ex Li et al. 2025) TaxID=1295366 RepID=UPI0015E7D768|nr:HAD family hydrolase [Mesorhizobium soli]